MPQEARDESQAPPKDLSLPHANARLTRTASDPPRPGAIVCGDALAERAGWARAEVCSLVKRIEEDYGRLAPILSEIRANAYYALWGYESYAAYVEDEFDWRPRKGDYIAAIGGLIASGCISPESVQRIGWSKIAALSSLPDDQLRGPQLGSWLASAERTSARALKERIHEARIGGRAIGEAAPEIFSPFTVRLAPGQRERVELALEIAERMDGSNKRCHLLDIICADFIAGRQKEVGLKLDVILRSLEAAFEVELMAFRVKGAGRECLFSSRGLRRYVDSVEVSQ